MFIGIMLNILLTSIVYININLSPINLNIVNKKTSNPFVLEVNSRSKFVFHVKQLVNNRITVSFIYSI